ncbi:MAG: ComEC family competence protein [Candidatus Pacebacteria bacterium]|nr:ComEC family competence protein [Candidatus Paceibacterota bacterium]MBP9832399.1 ComEC family competence protein [Candidatus Paceibacterota bacterium]
MIYHTEFFKSFFVRNVVPILCIGIVVGAGAYSVLVPEKLHSIFEDSVDTSVVIEGVVVRDSDQRERTTHLVVKVQKLNGVSVAEKVRVLLFADSFETAVYGDRISVKGKLKKPEPFETDSGRTFNYPKYLRAHNILYTISFPQVTKLATGEGHPIVAGLLSVKHLFIKGIERAVPEPQSALLAGLLLGEKQSLGEKITGAFRNAGVVHIIVLSGYNVALVIQWISFVFLKIFSRKVAYSFSAVFVIGFAVMTGGSETTIRALIMALLMMVATVLHRPKAALRMLAIAAAVMALWNPYIVLYDLSFQLSILATLGLILFSETIASRLKFIPDFRYFPFREIVSTTLATQVTVLPLLIFSIGAVSLVFLPANVLVLPAVPIAMFVGFFASIISLVSPVLAFPLSILGYGILSYIISIATFFGSLPFASLPIPREWMWPLLMILGFLYGVAGLLFLRLRKGNAIEPQRHSNF